MPPQRPHIPGLGDDRLFQLRLHIEIILMHIGVILEQIGQFFLVKACEGEVKRLRLQRFDLHPQEFLIPSGIHRHAVVGDDIRFLLRLCQMVGEYAGDLLDALLLCSKDTTVTGDNAVVTVDDNRIDKSELPQGGAQLVDLLRRVGPGVIRVRYQFFQWHKLHLGSSLQIQPLLFRRSCSIVSFGLSVNASVQFCLTIS